jgi:hypothetical protein
VPRKFLNLFAGFVCLLALSEACNASVLYGIELSSNSGFFGVDQITGAATLVGATGNHSIGDLTSDLASRFWSIDMANHALLSIDSATGAVSRTTPLATAGGSPVTLASLAWNPVTQTLYGTTTLGFGGLVPDQLYRINQNTGVSTLVGTLGFTGVFALGFDNTGILYGISPSQLLTIDTGTGVGALVAGVPLASAFDLAFRPEDNTMFVADSGAHALYTMNPSSGAVTLVGSYGNSANIVGLAFTGNNPEPGTIAMFAGGLGLLVWRAKRGSRRRVI